MANQRLIGNGLRCGKFSDRLNLEGVHLDGHILKFPSSLFRKDILSELITQNKLNRFLRKFRENVYPFIIIDPIIQLLVFFFYPLAFIPFVILDFRSSHIPTRNRTNDPLMF